MHVAVCVVGFRNPGDLVSCLSALRWSTHTDFEVVVCENGGAVAYAETRRALEGLIGPERRLTVISAPDNPGYAAGVNRCLDAAPDAEAWWILNPDTQPAPEALARMCARLACGDCAAVGSTVEQDGEVASRGGRWNPWLARAIAIDNGARTEPPRSVDEAAVSYLSGASMLVGRAFLDRVGQMREDYFLYGEEVEWCLRARAAGLKFGVASDAIVSHAQGTTTGSVSDVRRRGRMAVFLDERNKLLITRDCFPALLPAAVIGALAMLLLRFARRRAWAQTGYALDGWWNGLRGRRGKPAWVAG